MWDAWIVLCTIQASRENRIIKYDDNADGKIDYVEAGIIDEKKMSRAIKALVR